VGVVVADHQIEVSKMPSARPRFVIFTVSTGGEDAITPNQPGWRCGSNRSHITQGIDYVFFADALSYRGVSRAHIAYENLTRTSARAVKRKAPLNMWKLILLNGSLMPAVCRAKLPHQLPFYSVAQCLSRHVKIRPESYLRAIGKYDASLYIDANTRMGCRPHRLLFEEHLLQSGADMAAFSFRRSIVDEAVWVRMWAIDRKSYRNLLTARNISHATTSRTWVATQFREAIVNVTLGSSFRPATVFSTAFEQRVAEQVVKYATVEDIQPNSSTIYGKYILRRHGYRSERFNELWWREFSAGVPRDQLSILYCSREAARDVGFRLKRLDKRLINQYFFPLGRFRRYRYINETVPPADKYTFVNDVGRG